jgi:hypothetical protein
MQCLATKQITDSPESLTGKTKYSHIDVWIIREHIPIVMLILCDTMNGLTPPLYIHTSTTALSILNYLKSQNKSVHRMHIRDGVHHMIVSVGSATTVALGTVDWFGKRTMHTGTLQYEAPKMSPYIDKKSGSINAKPLSGASLFRAWSVGPIDGHLLWTTF